MIIDDTKAYEEEFEEYQDYDMAVPFEWLVILRRFLVYVWLDSIGLSNFRIVR